MGYPGQRTHPEVEKVVNDAFDKIHAAGKASGTPGGPAETAANIEKGVLYHYTHVPTMVSTYSNVFFEAVKAAKSPHIASQEFN